MSKDEFRKLVSSILEKRELTALLTSSKEADQLLAQSKNHINSAQMIKASDPEGAVQLAYDAARKSISALLNEVGLRVHERAGSHASFLKVAALEVFDQEIWQDLVWVRKLRNLAEYSDSDNQTIKLYQTGESIAAAKAMVTDAERILISIRTESY